MPRLHVLTNKMYTDPARLVGGIAIVVDILFATTGIAIALERGAREVIPTADPESARNCAERLVPGSVLLAGEQDGLPIPGFTPPWPHRLLREELSDKRVVYSTTNGTVALHLAEGADLVVAAAIINAEAVARYIRANHFGRDIVLICAGSGHSFSLEDFYGAGCLVSLLVRGGIECRVSDAARAAQLLHESAKSADCVENSYAGRMMAAHGLADDLRFCQQKSTFETVPVFQHGRIIRV